MLEIILRARSGVIGGVALAATLPLPLFFKKMTRFFDQMRIKPERFVERVEELFRQTPAAAAPSLEVLVREVLSLVEREMPEVDIGRLRRRVGGRRPRWEYAANRG